MMLAQTFYILEGEDKVIDMDNINRAKRIFPKNYLIHHLIWKDEDFWCVLSFTIIVKNDFLYYFFIASNVVNIR